MQARRYSAAFFSRSYLESWRRRCERGLQRSGEQKQKKRRTRRERERVAQQRLRRKKPSRWAKGILEEEITRSKDDGGGGEVNRGFYKNYPQARRPWRIGLNVSIFPPGNCPPMSPNRASSPFNNNDSFVANYHEAPPFTTASSSTAWIPPPHGISSRMEELFRV